MNMPTMSTAQNANKQLFPQSRAAMYFSGLLRFVAPAHWRAPVSPKLNCCAINFAGLLSSKVDGLSA